MPNTVRLHRVLATSPEKVFRAFPKNRVPFDTWKGKLGGWTQKYADSFNVEFTTEESGKGPRAGEVRLIEG